MMGEVNGVRNEGQQQPRSPACVLRILDIIQ